MYMHLTNFCHIAKELGDKSKGETFTHHAKLRLLLNRNMVFFLTKASVIKPVHHDTRKKSGRVASAKKSYLPLKGI